MEKSLKRNIISAVLISAALFSITGCFDGKDNSGADNSSKAETTTASEIQTTAEETTAASAETVVSTDKSKETTADTTEYLDDESYKKNLLKYFSDNVETFNLALSLANSFGIFCDMDADSILWVENDTNEIIMSGGQEIKNAEIDFEKHNTAVLAYPLNDEHFSNVEEYDDYMRSIFTEEFVNDCRMGAKRFIEYNGTVYIKEIHRGGILFDAWDTRYAEISQFERDKSFTVFTSCEGKNMNLSDPIYGSMKFVMTKDGWRIDEMSYNGVC